MHQLVNKIKRIPNADRVIIDSQSFFYHIVLLLQLGNTPQEIIKSFCDFLREQENQSQDTSTK